MDYLDCLEDLLEVVPPAPPTLEELLTSPDYFGLTTATPLQRAICRVIDGQPLGGLAAHPHVVQSLGVREVGGVKKIADMGRPDEFTLLAGIRTFKSLLMAPLAVRAALTCDTSHLGAGEVPRFSILSIKLDLAQVIYRHLLGNILAKPALRSMLLSEPTGDTVMLRGNGGRPVEIKVVAGARAGSSVVARWSVGVAYDEAPRMIGADEGVINLSDSVAAVRGRLLPGAQVCKIGSPWAPQGPIWDEYCEHFGKPTESLVVFRSRADWLNPYWWTEERMERLRERDPDTYATDVLAKFRSPEQSLFPLSLLEEHTRDHPRDLPPQPGYHYSAGMDPATRGNAWTLVVATKDDKKRVALCREWKGSTAKPLSPREVLGEIAELLEPYGVTTVETDQWSSDALRDIASDCGLYLVQRDWTASYKAELFGRLKNELEDGQLELCPDPQLRADMLAVRRKPTTNGVSIVFPLTSDGRHCDYAPALALAMGEFLLDNVETVPERGTPEYHEWLDEQQAQAEIEEQMGELEAEAIW